MTDDILSQLGLGTSGGYADPGLDAALGGGFTAPQTDSALAEAKVLARLRPGPQSGAQRFAAGFGAKTGKAPASKLGAFLDGGMAGFSGALGAGSQKTQLADQQARFNMLTKLLGIDRQLKRDAATDKYRQDALGVARDRSRRVGSGENRDPLVREERMQKLLAPFKQVLDDDDALRPDSPRRLSPEKRKAAEDAYAKEKARLEALGGGTPSAPTPAAPAPRAPVDRSIPSMAAPMPTPKAPDAPAPVAQPAPTPPEPPKKPTFTREQLIPAALEKMKKDGVPADAIIKGAKERFGVDLTPADLGLNAAPTATPAPAPETPPVDPMGNVTSPTGGPGFTDILKSLFGG